MYLNNPSNISCKAVGEIIQSFLFLSFYKKKSTQYEIIKKYF